MIQSRMWGIAGVGLVALGLGGCTPDNEISRNTRTDVFLQEPSAEVDILWVIDDSASMAEEQARVSSGFTTFVESLGETNIDFHIGVVSTDMDLANPNRGKLLGTPSFLTADDDYVTGFQDRVQLGTDGSDKEKGLSAGLAALSEPLASGANAGFKRPDAVLSVIFVSDENDCSDGEALSEMQGNACYEEEQLLIPVLDLLGDYKSLKDPGVRVLTSAIVGPDVQNGCADTWPGRRYQAMTDATGGVSGNICEDNYAEIMFDLGLSVSGILTTFELSKSAIEETIEVVVDDTLIASDPVTGWTYDSDYWLIRFDGDYVPERGSVISVSYEIASGGTKPDETVDTGAE